MFQSQGKATLFLKGGTQSNFILFPVTEDIRYLSTPIKDLALDIKNDLFLGDFIGFFSVRDFSTLVLSLPIGLSVHFII